MDRRSLGYSALLLLGPIVASVLLNRGLIQGVHSNACATASTLPAGSLPSTIPGVAPIPGILLIVDGDTGALLISISTDVGDATSLAGLACDENRNDISNNVIFNWSVNGGGNLSSVETFAGQTVKGLIKPETTVFTATVSGTINLTLTVAPLTSGITPPETSIPLAIGIKAPGAHRDAHGDTHRSAGARGGGWSARLADRANRVRSPTGGRGYRILLPVQPEPATSLAAGRSWRRRPRRNGRSGCAADTASGS